MNRTERFYKIEKLLRQHQTVSFAALQAALEVSRATLKRNLDYLRTRLNASIEWSRAAGGYRGAIATGQWYQYLGIWLAAAGAVDYPLNTTSASPARVRRCS